MSETENKLCPSSTCHKGALLLGIVNNNKKVSLLREAIPVNDKFIEQVSLAGNAEKRFRFAGKCAKCGCSQWTGSSCGIMNELAHANPLIAAADEQLPDCSIRSNCRWYSQEGAKACVICPYIVTQTENQIT